MIDLQRVHLLKKRAFPKVLSSSLPVAIAEWYLCKCPETAPAEAAPVYPDTSHLTAEVCSSGVIFMLGFEGAPDSFFPCLAHKIISALLFLFFVSTQNSFGGNAQFCVLDTLQDFVPEHSHPTDLACPVQ